MSKPPTRTAILESQLYDMLLDFARHGVACPEQAKLATLFDPPLTRHRIQEIMGNLRKQGRIRVTFVWHNLAIVDLPAEHCSTAPPDTSPLSRLPAEQVAAVKAEILAGLSLKAIMEKTGLKAKRVARISKWLRVAGVAAVESPAVAPSRKYVPLRRHPKFKGGRDASIPNDRLYGDLAPAVTALRRKFVPVCKSETAGYPRGQWLVGAKLVDAATLRAMAERHCGLRAP